MSLKKTIIDDLTAAMKSGDALVRDTLRMLKAEVMKYEVSGADKEATDEVVQDLIKRGVKQRKEAAEGFEKGGKSEAAQKELDEIGILEKYLPEQMSDEALREAVQGVIAQMSATAADFGKVMGATMGKVKGLADGNRVSAMVKELLK